MKTEKQTAIDFLNWCVENNIFKETTQIDSFYSKKLKFESLNIEQVFDLFEQDLSKTINVNYTDKILEKWSKNPTCMPFGNFGMPILKTVKFLEKKGVFTPKIKEISIPKKIVLK